MSNISLIDGVPNGESTNPVSKIMCVLRYFSLAMKAAPNKRKKKKLES